MFAVVSNDNLVISFRGTDGPLDAGSVTVDLMFAAEIQLFGYSPTLRIYASQFVQQVKTLIANSNPCTPVIFTGHSLGGMVAEQFTQWFHDPNDPHGLSLGTHSVTGFAFGSPGIIRSSDADTPPGTFYHLTRTQDLIGTYESGSHIGVTTSIDDRGSYSPIREHDIDRYAMQARVISESSISESIDAGSRIVFLPRTESNSYVLQPGSGSVFGGEFADIISVAGGSRLVADGGAGADVLIGGALDDVLAGGSGSDSLMGGNGRDTLAGGSGDDTMKGNAGGDWYNVGVGDGYDIIDDSGGEGTDTLILYTGNLATALSRSWFHPDGNDLLVQVPDGHGGLAINIRIKNMGSSAGGIEKVEVWGGVGDHRTDSPPNLAAIWEDITRPGAPTTPVVVGPGTAPPPLDLPSSGDFTWTGGSGGDIFTGTSGRDVVRGQGGADALGGAGGNDVLMGNGGADVLNGGADDDLLIDDDPGSRFADRLDGGSGDDSLVFYGAPSGERDYGDGGSGRDLALVDLSDRSRDWQLTDDDGDITLRLKSGSSEGWFDIRNVETIAVLFGSGNDTAFSDDQRAYFKGGGGEDTLSGSGHDDFLDGGADNDKLYGRGGVDWIDGGSGQDYAEVDLSGESRDLSFVAAAAATSTGFTFANGTHIRNVERIDVTLGTGDDRVWLGGSSERINTGGGDDLISTLLEGQDSLDGGGGRDRLIVDMSGGGSARLRANFNSSDNDFEIFSGTSYAGATRRLHVSSVEEVILRGGSGNDDLDGGNGDDELIGNAGDDRLDGKTGADRLEGGDGNDSLYLRSGADWADGGAGDDYGDLDRVGTTLGLTFDTRLAASAGGMLLADGTYARNIERWDVAMGSGNDIVATTLAGSRVFSLGGGQNRLIVDHTSKSSPLYGVMDTSYIYRVSASAAYDLATDRLYAIGAAELEIIGGSGADVFSGIEGADVLRGGAGDDVIYAGLGNDLIDGGAGQDRLYGQGGADVFVYRAGDSLYATYDLIYDFQTGLDRIDLHGIYAPTLVLGTVNDGASTFLFADAEGDGVWEFALRLEDARITGDDILVYDGQGAVGLMVYGSGSGDALIGGGGNDVVLGYAGNDHLAGGGGQDWIQGAEGDDGLAGGEGDDSVWGGDGNDLLDGGMGDDTIWGSAGIDTVSYAVAAGGVEIDLSWHEDQNTRAAGVDTLVSIENVIGSAFNDRLTASNQANVLTGGGGNDRFVFAAWEAAAGDRITDFDSGDLIDLSAIDANGAAAGDAAFAFIGAAAFNGQAGQLRVSGSGANWTVQGDLDGDGAADFAFDVKTLLPGQNFTAEAWVL